MVRPAGRDPFSLRDRTFVITGGTRGIGEAISLRFARAGARIIVNYIRNEAAAEQLLATATNEGLDIVLCRADLTTERGLEHLISFVEERNPQLSGLVHCAATGAHRRFEELTEKHLDWTLDLNLRVFFKLVKAVLGRFSEGSSILAVSSWGATRALPYYSLIGASKGALEALTRHLAAEVAGRGIRANILVAGTVQTDAWKAIPDGAKRIADAVRRTPTNRLVTAEEVAYGAQFLCSDAAAGVVGQTLVVDGGFGIVS
jgi:enoyl-[acyl-carrier protein] reductase III